jgi:hypothetical protein
MSNDYEAAEIVQIGEAQKIILGFKPGERWDSATQEFDCEPIIWDDCI